MSTQQHYTKAFILDVREQGEESQRFFLYTEEFGLISAIAQSSRRVSAKLRPQLNAFSIVEINLVFGEKRGWRITGVRELGSGYAFVGSAQYDILRSLTPFLMRFSGELPQEGLWRDLVALLRWFRTESGEFFQEFREEIILFYKLRFLFHLGYGETKDPLILKRPSREVLQTLRSHYPSYLQKFEEAVRSSQL